MLKTLLPLTFCALLICKPLFANNINKIVIVRGGGNYPPFEMMTFDNQLTGVHIDIIRAVAKLTHTNIEIKSLPWNRALHLLSIGKADAITYIGKTAAREKFAIFHEGNTLSTAKNAFFTLKKNLPECNVYTGNLMQFKGNRIGIINGYSYGEEFDNANYLTKDDGANTEKLLFEKLIKGRFLIGIANLNTIKYIAKNENLMDKIVFFKPYMQEIKQYIAFAKSDRHEQIAQKFASALTVFKTTPEYYKILTKYGL
jgi:polar amino acid transport system substrate-binding protein